MQKMRPLRCAHLVRALLLPAAVGLAPASCVSPKPIDTSTQHALRPSLAQLVNKLAQAEQIEGESVGMAGAASSVHATFRQLARLVRKEEALTLLDHPSPVVRGYLAGHIVAAFPEEAGALFPLLSDVTPVGVLSGCMEERLPLWVVLMRELLQHATHVPVQQLLLRFLRSPVPRQVEQAEARSSPPPSPSWALLVQLRSEALLTLAHVRPAEAKELALESVRDREMLPAALRALGAAHASEHASLVCSLASDRDVRVRAAAAAALAALGAGCVLPTLQKRIEDPATRYGSLPAGEDRDPRGAR